MITLCPRMMILLLLLQVFVFNFNFSEDKLRSFCCFHNNRIVANLIIVVRYDLFWFWGVGRCAFELLFDSCWQDWCFGVGNQMRLS